MPDTLGIITILLLFVAAPFAIVPLSALRLQLTKSLFRGLVTLSVAAAGAILFVEYSDRPPPFDLTPQMYAGALTLVVGLWLASVFLRPKYLLWFDLLSVGVIIASVWYFLQ